MKSTTEHFTWRFCFVAIALVATATALRVWPMQVLGTRLAWLTFYPAVMGAALYGGFVAGLVATLLSCLAVLLLLPVSMGQPMIKDSADWLGLAVFAVTSMAIASIAEGMRRARVQERLANARSTAAETELARLNARLELEVRERTGALRESEERFRMMVEGIVDYAIIILDADGRVTSWNAGAERLNGYRADEIIGQHFSRFYPMEEEARGKPTMELETAAATGRFEDEGWRVRKDGSRFWVNMVITAVRDESGALRGFAKITRDITERKRTEEAMRQSEARLNFALQASQIGAWQLDLLDHTAHRTLIHDRVFGYETLLPQWTYEMFLNHVLSEDRMEVDRKFREAIEAHAVWSFECRIRRPDGEVRWILAAGGLERNSEGKPVRMAGIVQDITERKRAEIEIGELNASLDRRVKERTAALLQVNETLADLKAALDEHAIVSITDARGKITYVNDRFCAIAKYSREELIGQDHHIVNSGHHPKAFIRKLWETITSGRVWKGEIKNRAKDGTIYWVDTTIVPFLGADGKPTQYIAIRADITERKLAEEHIVQLNADLRSRAAQLEAANKELESFAYSVSHDLRAPLRGMDGFSQALLEDYGDQLNATGQDCLRRIRAASQRMGQLIDDLLNLSRVTRSEMTLDPVDLTRLARKAITDLQPQQAGRAVQWEVSDPLTGRGDPRLLQLALENLLANALKFTGRCEHARIEFGQQTQGEEQVFFVRDNGAGFDMAFANRLFGAFQRLHSPQEFPGTGVGLATVQRIIHRHGGRVWADAQLGKGATFYFTLPAPN